MLEQAAGSRLQAEGSRQQAAGSRQQAAGSRKEEGSSRQQAAGRTPAHAPTIYTNLDVRSKAMMLRLMLPRMLPRRSIRLMLPRMLPLESPLHIRGIEDGGMVGWRDLCEACQPSANGIVPFA